MPATDTKSRKKSVTDTPTPTDQEESAPPLRLMGIGEVLSILKETYPEISISKIRFLEAEGLVTPERTSAGYRKFSQSDLDRLDYILRVQRDHYLPLRVIREQVEARDAGRPVPEAPTIPAFAPSREGEAALGARDGLTVTSDLIGDLAKPLGRMSQKDLIRASGIDPEVLAALEEHGFIRAGLTASGEPDYSQLDVRVANIVRQMRTYGIEPRHLRTVRTSADREAGLIDQAVRPLAHHRDGESSTGAAAKLTELSIRLHAALLEGAVRDTANQGE